MKNLVDDKGFFWWGWHRHYDVYQDKMLGHLGNPHEIHAIHCIAWDQLWQVNPQAVRREIEAIWQWHVIDKTTGEVNRHGDGQRGCDFAMSAGACAYAFAFLYTRTRRSGLAGPGQAARALLLGPAQSEDRLVCRSPQRRRRPLRRLALRHRGHRAVLPRLAEVLRVDGRKRSSRTMRWRT